jgi:Transposase IS116/IS110/IS902 family
VRGCLGGAARCSVRIERAAHPSPTALQHMRVDHGRTDVLVPHEFLHRPNIVTVLQFQALLGTGPVFASRLLVACGEQRERYASTAALQQYAGIVPVPSTAAKNLGSTGASRARHAFDKRL